ncbi:hypothetical protein [Erwinia tasmaniensis]|uniref:hypothetical protein n=1 Tax=Erwinia tasmaniensis TaxID=338565 RepID=UPI003A4DA1F0
MKKTVSILATLIFSTSAFAATPGKYDTKFNISANVPDSANITDPSGRPITDMDIVMKPAASGKMEADTPPLKLWNNDVNKLEVGLTLDDSNSANGDAFTLFSTQGEELNSMTYKIVTLTSAGNQVFATSGTTKDYNLVANNTHGELPINFRLISDKDYDQLGQGMYKGTVYANVVAKP